ncbi:UvrD-helicase domain-containing protein [Sphingomonas hankookensis]|uniref:UvrD-helicase domain-containing protein n=1 Tax=Sphingomonas hankookensis TaxID=563996 RepID=UPI001F5823FD|nr:UvrD-helicase domain-containing protein [Sphingomonas hankookensis]
MLGRAQTYRPGIWARMFGGGAWKLALDSRHDARMMLGGDEIACLDITAIDTSKALLWHTVEIRTSSRIEALTGLTGNAARRLRDDLLAFVNGHLGRLIDDDKEQLREVDRIVGAMVDAHRQYLAQSDIGRAIAAVPGDVARALSHPLFDAALIPATVRRHLPNAIGLLTDPDARTKYNEAFVTHELNTFGAFFDGLGEFPLSDEQREASIRLEDSNLLVASAGSGKSATMVGKVAYVLEKQLHEPGEILVMAFGKPAAEELKVRIAKQLGLEPGDLKCRVTTFHALGLSIIKEVEGRPPQMVNWVESATGEARFVDGIIKDLVENDEDFRRLWVEILLLYPKAHIPPAEFKTPEEYRDYMADNNGKRPKAIATLSGDYVQSLEEMRIANWLWMHTVDFQYERQTQTMDEDGSPRWLKPDFYYPATGTLHEHFAINANGTSPFENYVEHANLKRAGYARIGADLFETTSAQASDGSLLDRLRDELVDRGIQLAERSADDTLRAAAPLVLAHYRKIIGVCIKHIRASDLTLDMLLEKAKSLHDRNRAERFAKVVTKITDAYTRRLDQQRRIDFDSMIGDAVKMVETGRYRSPFSLILVDEFQDISDPRAKLIKALKHQKPFTKLFAVGDDWQSIYRFTGSDLTIFTQFETNFGASWQGRLERTYRCNQMLADAAASFIQRNPAQLKKTVRSSRQAIPRSIRAIPVKTGKNKSAFADACHRVLDRLDTFLSGNAEQWRRHDGEKLKVLVLWRYNLLNPFHGNSPEFANIVVTGKSFHSSKGLEADYTILLDVSEGDYGVPSRIEDDELLNLVIPRPETFEYAEERRLFYVALTRASRGTFLLYDRDQPSRYIAELCDLAGDDVRFESVDGTRLWQCPVCITGELADRIDEGGATVIGCSAHPRCHYDRPGTPARLG